MKRGAVRRANSKLVNFLMPIPLIEQLDRCVHRQDTDRAKFVRSAIREKISRSMEEEAA